MKAYIISRNRLTLTVNMADWLADFVEPIIVDNDSDYPPLLRYYETCLYKVIRVDTNLGSEVIWKTGIVDDYSSGESYLVTDPDLDMRLYNVHGYRKFGQHLWARGNTPPQAPAAPTT